MFLPNGFSWHRTPGDRFVMVNMLVFKDMATGEGFDEQTVTEYPNRAAYLLALSDPRVAAVSLFRADGLVTHWIYTAGEAQIDLGL